MTELQGYIAILVTTVGMLTGGVIWYRNNRVANSQANATVAANYADEQVHSGQASEIAALRNRISALDSAFVSQAAALSKFAKRVSDLEAMLVGVSQHHDNLLLCTACKHSNARVLEALGKVLKLVEVQDADRAR